MKRLNGGESVHAVRPSSACCQCRAGRGGRSSADDHRPRERDIWPTCERRREGGEGERPIRFGSERGDVKKSKLAIAVVEFI